MNYKSLLSNHNLDFYRNKIINSVEQGDLETCYYYLKKWTYQMSSGENKILDEIPFLIKLYIQYIDALDPELLKELSNLNDKKKSLETCVIEILRRVVLSPKGNSLDLLKSSYSIQLDNLPETEFKTMLLNKINTPPEEAFGNWSGFRLKDPVEIVALMDLFVYYLEKSDNMVFYYYNKILSLKSLKLKCGQRLRSWKPSQFNISKALGGRFQLEAVIWESLLEFSQNKPILLGVLERLYYWTYSNNLCRVSSHSNHYFLEMGILYCLRYPTTKIQKHVLTDLNTKELSFLKELNTLPKSHPITELSSNLLGKDIVYQSNLLEINTLSIKHRENSKSKKRKGNYMGKKKNKKWESTGDEILTELTEDPIPMDSIQK